MRGATVKELVDDLNKTQAKTPLGAVFGCGFSILGAILILLAPLGTEAPYVTGGSVILIAAFPAWVIGEWIDSFMRRSVLFYSLEGTSQTAYQELTKCFDALASCDGKWHIPSGGAIQDLTTWKRNAGASYLIDRKKAELYYRLPKILRCNITPPTIRLGSRWFYFLPDLMLVKHGRRYGAVTYDDLKVIAQPSRFIESGSPPKDAQVIDYTWQHPNKNGGPDRRFRNNRKLSVCLYDAILMSSSSGVNELAQFSRAGSASPFSNAIQGLPRKEASGGLDALIRLSRDETNQGMKESIAETSPTTQSFGWPLLVAVTAVIAGLATLTTSRTRATFDAATAYPRETFERLSVSKKDTMPRDLQSIRSEPEKPQTVSDKAGISIVTIKISANIRSGPSASSTIIGTADPGERFSVFAQSNGWVQVGQEKPIGWIAKTLLTP